MPRGDGTGPQGAGAMSGRGLGFCAGFDAPGYMQGGIGAGRRFGMGFGRGFGAGMGMAHRRFGRRFWGPFANFGAPAAWGYPVETVDEKSVLQNQLNILENQLSGIKARLEEIEKADSEE